MKKATLSQEVVRRMANTDEEQPQQLRNEILEKFTIKMKCSGYNFKQRSEIIISGLKGYERKLKRAAEGKQELHREGKATLGARSKKKLLAKFNWYKKKKNTEEEEQKAGCGKKNLFQGRYSNKKNTPGTRGGLGGRNQKVAIKGRKNSRKSAFVKKKKYIYIYIFYIPTIYFQPREFPRSGSKAKDGGEKERKKDRKLVITMANYASKMPPRVAHAK